MTAFFSGTPPTMSGLQLSPVLNLLHARRVTGDAFISVEIGASQTDWEPSGLAEALVISVTQDGGPFDIRSLDGGDVKVAKVILNDDDSENLTLKHEYTSGTTPEMRFNLGGSDVVIAPGYGACLVYDTTSSRWNCVAVAIPYPLANDPGTPGADGSLWYAGSGVPSPSPDFGSDGDMYLNTANGDVYQKQSGAWVLLLNISGTDGLPGLNWRQAWAISSPANEYEVNDGVSNGGKSWICIQAHTASSDNEPGVGGSYTDYWGLLADKGADGAGAVDSVFGRTGAVVAVAGDYAASQITNDSAVSGSNVDGALNALNSGKASTAALATAVPDQIHAASSKSTPVDTDELGIADSATSPSWTLKKLTWANLRATLKAYFDGIYTTASATINDGYLVVGDGGSRGVKKSSGAPGDAAFKNTGTTTGTLAAGDDSRITGAAQKAGNQNLTGGFTTDVYDDGTKSSGTFTPSPLDGAIHKCVNGGAFTLAPYTTKAHTLVLDITNNGSAGAITTSGFTKQTGDSFDTTDTHVWRCFISYGQAGSHLHVQAMF